MPESMSLEHLSLQFKAYLFILHTVILGWIVHIFINVYRNQSLKGSNSQYVINVTKSSPSVRIVHVDDKRVTVESCHWLNSILKWLYVNAVNTPDLVKIWLTMLNEKLKTDKGAMQFTINGIVPGSLPPTLTNVYCSNTDSNVQCVAMHIETTKLGFNISWFENNNRSDKSMDAEVAITKLSGEIIFQVFARQAHYDLTVKFIGDPELKVTSSDILEDSDRSAVEEKLKEVICKTVVNIPLTKGKPGDETISGNLIPESGSSCLDIDGKLLVKVLKASGLSGIDKTDVPDAYCVVSSREPSQKKKTNTIKGTKDPVWNESHVLDVSKNTKEIVFDIYNEQKASEETNFLGQVIVPLAMIGKDQSCRLILPILPTSATNSYVSGQINLEFVYDKDGKAFDVSTEETSSASKSASEEKPKTDQQRAKVLVEDVRPSSPQRLVFSMATLDIIEDDDDQLKFVPLMDHGIGRGDIVTAEQDISERSAHGGYETNPALIQENQRHHEMLEELIELDRRTTVDDRSKTEENQKKTAPIDNISERPSSRHSQQASPSSSPVPVAVTVSPEAPRDTRTTQEVTTPSHGNVEGAPLSQNKETKPVTLDENLMEDLTPDTRRKVFRKAFSMRINRNNESSSEIAETDVQQSRSAEIEKRHSFSGVEKVQQPKKKSGSDVSLSSLYDSTKSVLLVETRDRGQIKYYQIPPLMAKRGTYDHKGTKLHICNDHLFVATHFTGTLPSCNVCKSPLTGYFGKQGYECRDCHMITHKRCHYEASTVCTKSSLSSLKIVILEERPE